MDVRNGDLYRSMAEARDAGVPEEALVEVRGDEVAAKELARLVALAREMERSATEPEPGAS